MRAQIDASSLELMRAACNAADVASIDCFHKRVQSASAHVGEQNGEFASGIHITFDAHEKRSPVDRL